MDGENTCPVPATFISKIKKSIDGDMVCINDMTIQLHNYTEELIGSSPECDAPDAKNVVPPLAFGGEAGKIEELSRQLTTAVNKIQLAVNRLTSSGLI